MLMFFGVILLWGYSSRPALYNFANWVAPDHVPDWHTYKMQRGEIEDIENTAEPLSDPEYQEAIDLTDLIVTPEPIVIEVVQPEPIELTVITPDPVASQPEINQETNSSQYQNMAQKFCGTCQGYTINIRYTHYYPPLGGENCWLWNEETQYCDSPTYSGIPWESALYWGAACPYDWGIGTWIEVPYWGSVMCIDRGSMVCVQTADGWLCDVDILAPSIGNIDGQVLQSVVFIPE